PVTASQSRHERLALELSCAICLQLYRDPVALPCGHNYCLGCIQNAASAEDPKSPKRCPECREEYGSLETLPKNFKLTAVKFCTRLELPAERDGKRCPVHLKVTEYLCVQERLFLCSDCLMEGSHQHHEVQTFEVAKEEMKRVLEELGKSVSDKLQITEALVKSASEGPTDKAEDKLVARANILLDNMTSLISTYKVRMRHQTQRQMSEGLAANVTIPALPSQESSNAKQLRSILRTDAFRSEMSLLLEYLHGMMNPLDLTFNPATAHPSLLLSSDLKTVKQCAGVKSSTAGDQSERFSTATQVMCTQGFSTGVHMWAVEVGPGCMWSLGLCYKNIPRKGDHSRLGHNTSSWRLQWKSKKLTACYDSANVAIGEGLVMPPKKVEVTLDYEGGTIAFHSSGQGGRRQHLHTFSAMFKDTVYPAFSMNIISAFEVCHKSFACSFT
uniref:Tripartite motif containing 25 n=1 Tax=Sinocyclocheilus anshuiensis TaxID=1608454 RepID=A0A671LA89_9TELE